MVVVNYCLSDRRYVTSGVLLRPMLDPLWFVIYINNLDDHAVNSDFKYEDDTNK